MSCSLLCSNILLITETPSEEDISCKLGVRSSETENTEMFAVTASLSSALLFVCVFMVVSADQKNIKAESGQDVTLPCRAPNIIIGVKWIRAGLEPEYVLFYRDEQFDSDSQHPSFKNRVDLQDRQMKDGDVSLILKNVTINDTGTYECGVIQTGTLKFLCNISLHVVPPGQTGGHTEDGGKEEEEKQEEEKQEQSVGMIAGLIVSAVLLAAAAVVGCLVYRKHKEQKQSLHPHQLPDELQYGNGSAIHTESETPALLKQTEG